LAAAQVEDLQQRQEHWVFADLIGKSRHIRTVPKPHWVAEAVRRLVNRSWRLIEGGVFRAINKVARISPKGLSRKALELQL
jgi:hypothetical protein